MDEVTRALFVSSMEFLTISESWLDESDSDDSIYVSGYCSQRFDRTEASNKESGGGVLIYYKDFLNCVGCPEFNTCTPHLECTWVKLKKEGVQ